MVHSLAVTHPVLSPAVITVPAPRTFWSYTALAGRFTELSSIGGIASLTLACTLVLNAQQHAEPVAWIACMPRIFFPPDVAANGIDLDALVVVRVADARAAARAADTLVRCGAFGLVVLDLGADGAVPIALQARLVQLARRSDTAILCLTEKPDTMPSLSSLVSLRATARRQPLTPGAFACELTVLKDKRNSPGWTHTEVCRGPVGLC
jgi:recombination protein RecA